MKRIIYTCIAWALIVPSAFATGIDTRSLDELYSAALAEGAK